MKDRVQRYNAGRDMTVKHGLIYDLSCMMTRKNDRQDACPTGRIAPLLVPSDGGTGILPVI